NSPRGFVHATIDHGPTAAYEPAHGGAQLAQHEIPLGMPIVLPLLLPGHARSYAFVQFARELTCPSVEVRDRFGHDDPRGGVHRPAGGAGRSNGPRLLRVLSDR